MKYRLTINNFRNEGYIMHKGVFLHPSVSTEEALNKSIYKYMRFEHLLNMLISKKLYIANRYTFTDLVEKGYKSNLKYLFPMDYIHKNKKEKEELTQKRFNFDYEVYYLVGLTMNTIMELKRQMKITLCGRLTLIKM